MFYSLFLCNFKVKNAYGLWLYSRKFRQASIAYMVTHKKSGRISVALGSATGTRTPVYGVRGRCPRPLDDSTVTVCLTSFSKASAKVLLFFDMTKYFSKKMQKSSIFLYFCCFLGQNKRFFAPKHAFSRQNTCVCANFVVTLHDYLE